MTNGYIYKDVKRQEYKLLPNSKNIKTPLLISSCLLGHNVKYDGTNNCLDLKTIEKLKEKYQLFDFCPEVIGGLPTPRTPCEIISQNPLQVIDKNGDDKTSNFIIGANKTFEFCKSKGIKIALMKANSPSCSNKFIYDGTFTSRKIKGYGVTVDKLSENNIIIKNEKQVESLYQRIENKC